MSYTPSEDEAGTRLTQYNDGAWDPASNPLGFDAGGNQAGVFTRMLKDVALFQRATVRVVGETLSAMQTSAAALLAGMTAKIDEHTTLLDRLKAATAAAANGPVFSVNGMGGAVVLPDVPKVLPPIVTQPVAGSTPSLTGGALVLSVDRLTSLYGEAQKTIRFQISTAAGFAANTIVYDSGVLAQASVSASLANAQATLTGGTTYYVRAIQTDAKDVSSGWSAPVSFVFPRLPNAPVMSAPADGATAVGAQNAPITLTAGAYSHPGGTAQAARRFELSKDNFATIVTVNGTVGQASATIPSPRDVLTAGSAYKVRAVDVDTNGGASVGVPTTFTTVAQFRPNIGDPYASGFFYGQNVYRGNIWDGVLAPKSGGEFAVRAWTNTRSGAGGADLWDGFRNTEIQVEFSNANPSYAVLPSLACANLVLNAVDDWYMAAQNEAIAYIKALGTQTTAVAAFKAGGAEAIAYTTFWTSTEADSSNAISVNGTATSFGQNDKLTQLQYRAVRRVLANPVPIGTRVQGGYVAAYHVHNGIIYALIVPPKAVGETSLPFGPSGSSPVFSSTTDGYSITETLASGNYGSYPAAKFCWDFAFDGCTDFYLGATQEQVAVASNLNPFQTTVDLFKAGGAEVFDATNYRHASTESSSTLSQVVLFDRGQTISSGDKGTARGLRPIRRVPITQLAA